MDAVRRFDTPAGFAHIPGMAEDKARREIRIPVPDLDDIKRKATEAKDHAMVATGMWHRRHPILAAIIFVMVLQFILVLIRQG